MNKWNAAVIHSQRRTLSIQITPEGELVVRAPARLPQREIDRFLEEKAAWIEKTMEKVRAANQAGEEAPLRAENIQALARQAAKELPPRVAAYAQRMQVTYGRITIRSQTGRWGSCSSAGNLNFNCLLMLAPESVQDYVIVHELSHRLHMDHSAAFWRTVEAVLPQYKRERPGANPRESSCWRGCAAAENRPCASNGSKCALAGNI